ncbi:uridine diphosphate-N-acetylglucosamine-binding protein YvcK [Corynebacterium mendelii]|uniref:Putative gluconeogenesis factor n=1 Tax=Corynebacterium mendelii TaxID=2765362 RepID=A0A939IWV7_9CORY|nr:uridine diphosphate-N-acetylglucosamine-binding protein YvcK [Corynebacterium mendelii]MBN9643433.1 uridine diphosphate-N-acetylglucosamine-binding protein YvcK [Corynebacterium mendelii]
MSTSGNRHHCTPILPAELDTITALGGGHGLFQTLRASRALKAPFINAVVTVADDGGSSGRLRRELGIIPPGDLRMALAALARDDDDGRMWETLIQHRFGGTGGMAGHAVGNLLIAGLTDVLGDHIAALDAVADLVGARGRVLPMSNQPLEIEADVAGLDDDPRVVHPVRGQVSVATTPGSVRRVRLKPAAPTACPEAVEAIAGADLVTLGPGSWFTSVIPHLLVPGIVTALNNTRAVKVVVLNLTAEPGETAGFSAERHIHMLTQHAPQLKVDRFIVDENTIYSGTERRHLARAAASLGAEVLFADVTTDGDKTRHDPAKLGAALGRAFEQGASGS